MREDKVYFLAISGFVLLTYSVYPCFHLSVSTEPYSLYPLLTQGFLSGHFFLNVYPSPELLSLPNPYEPIANDLLRLHDASLYQGKYYLYFGFLPVLTFYLPFKVFTGFYPTDALASVFYLNLGFIVSFLLLMKIKRQYFQQLSDLQLVLAGFLLGFVNGAPFLLSRPQVYEVAIASAYCFMMIALFFLYELVHKDYKTRHVFFYSLCLSLSVAGRPHFAFICFILSLAVALYLLRYAPKYKLPRVLSALFLPAFFVALSIAFYNYLRFGSIMDFGHIWQLSCHDIKSMHGEFVNLTKIPRNLWYSFYYYFLQPFTVSAKFPYFGLQSTNCWYVINKDYYVEAIAGILTTAPFTLLSLALPKLLANRVQEKKENNSLVRFIRFLMLVPAINIGFLLLLPFSVQRYEVDFIPYLVILSILTLWILEAQAVNTKWFNLVKLIFIISASFSILLGLSFGLAFWTLE